MKCWVLEELLNLNYKNGEKIEECSVDGNPHILQNRVMKLEKKWDLNISWKVLLTKVKRNDRTKHYVW